MDIVTGSQEIATQNFEIGFGETLTITDELKIDGVVQDLTGWTITWAAALNEEAAYKNQRLWWLAGTIIEDGTRFQLQATIDTRADKIIYDVLFNDGSESRHRLKGIIHIRNRVTPSGAPS